MNKEERNVRQIIYNKRHRQKYPWLNSFYAARSRCKDSKKKYYYNMEFSMTRDDFKELWFKDKAYLLKKPSIDRRCDDIGYIKSNCRFIELKENKKRYNNI